MICGNAPAGVIVVYQQKGKYAWINPGSEKNKAWNSRYIDVIVAESPDATRAWVIEVETDDSVSDSEARDQWQDYDYNPGTAHERLLRLPWEGIYTP